jgi:hypothetical protein
MDQREEFRERLNDPGKDGGADRRGGAASLESSVTDTNFANILPSS